MIRPVATAAARMVAEGTDVISRNMVSMLLVVALNRSSGAGWIRGDND
jgi:hypothetical protein